MPTFIMLSRLAPGAVTSPAALEHLERQAMERVRAECPNVEWCNPLAVLGPCDYLVAGPPGGASALQDDPAAPSSKAATLPTGKKNLSL